jgi:gamma-glutamylaminecyclotransferase
MLLFVFGTLKKGLPLHDKGLGDATFLGRYRTVDPYPLVIAGPWYAPILLDEPGTGLQVEGELYDVPPEGFDLLDAFESIGLPGNLRIAIRVVPLEGGRACVALAYAKERALASPLHSGYLSNYQDRRFIPAQQRTGREPGDHVYLYRAADLLIREYGLHGAIVRALARRDCLLAADQVAGAELWTRVIQILAVLGR